MEDLKNPQDTAPVAETVVEQEPVAVKEDTTPVVETPKEEMVSVKELEKARMRQNQLENELEEARKLAASAGNDDLVASLTSKLAKYEAERDNEVQTAKVKAYESTLETVFDKVSGNYPDSVKKAAQLIKDQIGISAIVKDAAYSFEAEERIKGLLDGLNKEVIVEKPEIKVEAQNLPYTPPTQGEVAIAEGHQNMGQGEEDLLSSIARDSFAEIGVKI